METKMNHDRKMKSTNNNASNNSVRFHTRIYCRAIPQLASYSEEDISTLWYHREEFVAMFEETKDIIDIMALEDKSDARRMEDSYCERGLESRYGDRAEVRRRAKEDGLDAVLDTQNDHMETEDDDEVSNAIASAYSKVSKSCHEDAHLLALLDEEEAQRIMRETILSPVSRVRKMRKRVKSKQPPRHRSLEEEKPKKVVAEETSGEEFRRHSYCNLADAKKTVRFFPKAKTRTVPHIKDISEDHASILWYQPTEIKVMMDDQKKTARLVEKFDCYQDTNDCAVRGCEYMTKENIRKRKRQQTIARGAVFKEQVRQLRDGENNPEQLAAAYKAAVVKSVLEAQRMGQRDELDVLALEAEEKVPGEKRSLRNIKVEAKRRFLLEAEKSRKKKTRSSGKKS